MSTIDFVAPWGENFSNTSVIIGQYADGNLAVQLESDLGEPLTTLSLNLADYGLFPAPGCIFVGDYSQHQGMLPAAQNAGLLTPTDRVVTFGPYKTTAHEARVNPQFLNGSH